ncbi:MAG: cation:proton antiporter [Saccharospirillum sp.]|nr:cation:proton antiporter [Saccharospirillum sp.]
MASILEYAINFSFISLIFGLVFCLMRLVKGPTLADRVVALDLIAFLTIGFIAVYSISSNEPAFLDIAITLALVAFLGTIAFARWIIKSQLDKVVDSEEEL